MTIQSVVWTIMLMGVGLVALVFLYVISRARKPATEAQTRQSTHTAHVIQAWFFGILVLGFFVGSWATMRHFPIPDQHGALAADATVEVEGFMWGWNIEPTTVKAGQSVEFRVTSKDVNHGFALYGPDGHIVTQTQAMPGFVNKLLYTFKEPGTYTVQCLEYCGIGHGTMRTTLQVLAAQEEK